MDSAEGTTRSSGSSAAASALLAAFLTDDPSASGEAARVAGCTVVRRLGGGGGGVVYEGVDPRRGRRVAIKVIATSGLDERALRRVRREADLLVTLGDACVFVPTVYDVIDQPDSICLVMQMIEGERLEDAVRDRPLRDRVAIMAEIARQVGELHRHGVIHRDLKPSNILITPDGEPRIIDFGVASSASAAGVTLTRPGEVVGSLPFMAPEVLAGDPDRVTTACDVYGLGATAYVVLTGEPPHEASDHVIAAIDRKRSEDPRDPRTWSPETPVSLRAILMTACARSPEARYDSAAGLADDLDRWRRGEPVSVSPPSGLGRLRATIRRRPILTTAVVCVTMSLAALTATVAAIQFLALQPAAIDVIDGGDTAVVLSRAGHSLHRWSAGPCGGVRLARWMTAAAATAADDGERVVLGVQRINRSEAPGIPGQLSVFRPDACNAPVWTTGSTPADLHPPPLPPWSRVRRMQIYDANPAMNFSGGLVADVLEASPGEEIVAVFNHVTDAPALIRVYRAIDGAVLFEAWHMGQITGLMWSDAHRQLVLSGWNNHAAWPERGGSISDPAAMPFVIFALRPTMNDIARDAWIAEGPGRPGTAVLWYRTIMPAELSVTIARAELRSPTAADAVAHWHLSGPRYEKNADCGVTFVLSADGEVLDLWGNDQFLASPWGVFDEMVIGDLPEIQPETSRSSVEGE